MNCIELPPKYLDDDGVLSQLAASEALEDQAYSEPLESARDEEDDAGYIELLQSEPYDMEEVTSVDIFNPESKGCLAGLPDEENVEDSVELQIQELLATENPVSEADYQDYIEAMQNHQLLPIQK